MSRATFTRLRQLEVKARLDGSLENLKDKQLFNTFRWIIDREGGIEAVSASLRGSGDDEEAALYQSLYACKTAAEFIALGC